jgi:hypothetical protein
MKHQIVDHHPDVRVASVEDDRRATKRPGSRI